jgi:hypothetical protein
MGVKKNVWAMLGYGPSVTTMAFAQSDRPRKLSI